jgi:CheY-like chemotaxis protein
MGMQGLRKAQRPRRVLLVEDNEDLLRPLDKLLNGAGHHVISARSGDEALRLAREFHPEVAVLDINLPEMDGYAVAEKLDGAVLIAITGYGTPDDLERSKRLGFRAHLTKPLDLELLLNTIESV